MIKHLLMLSAATPALVAFAGAAHAQSSASPHTYGTRYDEAGRVTGTISPNSTTHGYSYFLATRTTYDPAGRPTKVESGYLTAWQSEAVAPASWSGFNLSQYTQITYDGMGRKLTERVVGSDLNPYALTQYSYDSAGRLECTAVRMNPAVYGSLPGSACTLGTAGSHGSDRITRNVYDVAGQLLQVREGVGSGVEAAEVTYTYTANGKMAQVIDAEGNRAEQRYDGHDRQVRWVFPSATKPTSFSDTTPATTVSTAGSLNEGDYEQYTYDANGNRLSLRKRDNSTLSYQYDAHNRMTVKAVPGSTTHTRDVYFGYDLRGLMTYARFDTIGGEGVTNLYDGFGRRTSETLTMDSVSRTISSGFDLNGNRTRLTYPDGNYADYHQDGLDRLYAALLNASSGLFRTVLDNQGRISLLHSANTTIGDWGTSSAYAYDPVSRLSSRWTSFTNPTTFAYNPASQIASRIDNNDGFAFTAYANVNRGYTPNGLNQYSAVGGATFGHDANGNLTSDGTQTFTYDAENRLIGRSGGGTTAVLRYDPLGRLYEVYGSDTGMTRLLHDGDELLAEYNTSGTLLRRYAHLGAAGDDPFVWFEGSGVTHGERRYLYADERGSIVAVTNSVGSLNYINAYDEYGIPNSAGNDISTRGRFRYTGQAWIPELGMYYYKARMYSPTLGRFMQVDPIGYEDQFNLYAYVGNDPVNSLDPNGLERRTVDLSFEAFGQELGVSLNVDTESGELGGSVQVGIGLGVGADVGASYTSEPSSSLGNRAALVVEGRAEAEVGVRGGEANSLAANAFASTGTASISTDQGWITTPGSIEASAVAGTRRRATANAEPTPDRYGAAAEVRGTVSARAEGNISYRQIANRARGLVRDARRSLRDLSDRLSRRLR